MSVPITLVVNGISYPVDVDPHASLLHTVREQVGLTGAKEGCDDSECGACMMLVDGRPTNSCSYLAVQADGSQVTTVEGLSDVGGGSGGSGHGSGNGAGDRSEQLTALQQACKAPLAPHYFQLAVMGDLRDADLAGCLAALGELCDESRARRAAALA